MDACEDYNVSFTNVYYEKVRDFTGMSMAKINLICYYKSEMST